MIGDFEGSHDPLITLMPVGRIPEVGTQALGQEAPWLHVADNSNMSPCAVECEGVAGGLAKPPSWETWRRVLNQWVPGSSLQRRIPAGVRRKQGQVHLSRGETKDGLSYTQSSTLC